MANSSLLPRVLLSLAILLTAAAGVKNYMSRADIKAAADEKDKIQKQVAASESSAAKAVAEAKAAKEELKKLQDANASNTALSDLTAEMNKAKKETQDARTELQTKDAKIADLEKKVAEASEQKAPVQDPALAGKLADAEKAQKEAEQVAKTLQEQKEAAEKKATVLQQDAEMRAKMVLRPGLEGKVLAVNPGWNFVVLSLGDKQGVVAGVPLIVKRGDTMVAKLRVTSVEPSTSIADIQAGTLSKGNMIQAGDVVIFPGS